MVAIAELLKTQVVCAGANAFNRHHLQYHGSTLTMTHPQVTS